MTRSRPIFLLAGAVYIIVILSSRLTDRFILFPSTEPINPGAAHRQLIAFESGELELWTATSELARQRNNVDVYVLRFYGNADRAERWVALEADAWNGRAVELWGMNYPGFGGSSGPARLKRIPGAALAAFDALRTRAGSKPIVLSGASIGATAALHVAANRNVTGIILHNPPPLRQMILRDFGWWNLWLLAGPIALQIPPELDSIENAKRIHVPAVFLLAEKDEVVAPKFQRLVFDAFAGNKRAINVPGAYHNSPIEGDVVTELRKSCDWLLPP
jgi:uncharacterized protein